MGRIGYAILLLALLGSCACGFRAALELGEAARRPWRTGYGLGMAGALTGLLLRPIALRGV